MRVLREDTKARGYDTWDQIWDVDLYRIQGSIGLSGDSDMRPLWK